MHVGLLHEFGALPLWTLASFALLNVSAFIALEVSNGGRTLVTSEIAEMLALAEIASVPLVCASEIRQQGAANTLRSLRKCGVTDAVAPTTACVEALSRLEVMKRAYRS